MMTLPSIFQIMLMESSTTNNQSFIDILGKGLKHSLFFLLYCTRAREKNNAYYENQGNKIYIF